MAFIKKAINKTAHAVGGEKTVKCSMKFAVVSCDVES